MASQSKRARQNGNNEHEIKDICWQIQEHHTLNPYENLIPLVFFTLSKLRSLKWSAQKERFDWDQSLYRPQHPSVDLSAFQVSGSSVSMTHPFPPPTVSSAQSRLLLQESLSKNAEERLD